MRNGEFVYRSPRRKGAGPSAAKSEREEPGTAWSPRAVIEPAAWAVAMATAYPEEIAAVVKTGRDKFIDLNLDRRLRITRNGLMARCTVLRQDGCPVRAFEAYRVADGRVVVRAAWNSFTDRRDVAHHREREPA